MTTTETVKAYVVSYYNPDLDGVASAVALSDLHRIERTVESRPLILGACDAETELVFRVLNSDLPKSSDTCPDDVAIYLVDTHHVEQLKGRIRLDRVLAIYDHHPGGNLAAFPNATIINESIGAVATLLAEKYRDKAYSISPTIAGLLQAAIMSNTMSFSAPTTTERDRVASEWLSAVAALPKDLPDRMRQARSDVSSRRTLDLLLANSKTFDLGPAQIAIAQIEVSNIDEFLARPDLPDALDHLKGSEGTPHAFVSVVDETAQKTAVFASDRKTLRLLEAALGTAFRDNVARFDRVLLRKSDLVPPLLSYCRENPDAAGI